MSRSPKSDEFLGVARSARRGARINTAKPSHITKATNQLNLGVAPLVARYLGVVEAASSSLVTQTKTRVHNEPSFFFYFLANPREISRF